MRQVITRRLARLSRRAYTVLAAASVIDNFDLDLLSALTDMAAAAVAAGLDEAQSRHVSSSWTEDGYRFAHALIRQTLLDTQPAGTRAELHRRAATMLETRLTDATPDARAALAEQAAAHWARVAGRGPPAGRAARRRGGPECTGPARLRPRRPPVPVGARPRRRQPATRSPSSAKRRSSPASSPKAARRWPPPRLRAAVERRGEALARAVLAAGSGVGGYEVDVRDEQQAAWLHDALSLLGDDDSRLRAAALARVALLDASLPVDTRAALADDAAAMAARLGDTAGEVAALAARCDVLSGPDHVDDRLAATTRMVELAQRQRDPVILLVARRHRLLALLEHGEIGRVDDEIAAYARTSDHLRLPLYSWIVPVWRACGRSWTAT